MWYLQTLLNTQRIADETCNVTYLSPIRFTLYIMITRTDTLKKCMVKHYSLGQNCQLQQYNFFKDLTPLNRFHMGFL